MLMLCSKNSRSTLMLLLTTIICERVRRTSVIHAYWWRNLLVCIFPQYDDMRDARWSSSLTTINNDRVVSSCVPNNNSIPSAFNRHLRKQHKDIRENTDRKTQATTENATQTRPHDSHGTVLRRYYFSFKIRVLVFVDIFNSIYTFVCGKRTFVCSEYKIWKLTENNRRNSGSFVAYPRNSLENLTIKWRKSKK